MISRRAVGGPAAFAFYCAATVLMTWPLAARLGRDLPADLVDPLFNTWVLGWNYHAAGLSPGGPADVSYWDGNIFHPAKGSLARSEHLLPQALLGLPLFALTRDLPLTYGLLFMATFALSGTFLFLLVRDETGDAGAAVGAGLLFAFALARWNHLSHLQALSVQWMPLALLAVRRVADPAPRARARTALAVAGLALVVAAQLLSSGYYLLYFPLPLILFAVVEAARAGRRPAWLRLGAAAALGAAIVVPLALPYLGTHGAARDLASVVEYSADVLAWLTAPSASHLWGGMEAFVRGNVRLFPGLVTPALVLSALVFAWRSAAAGSNVERPPGRRVARLAAALLAALAVLAALLALASAGVITVGPLQLRMTTLRRPLILLALAAGLAAHGWPGLATRVRAFLARREVVHAALAMLCAWLSLGPLVTANGWPAPVSSPYALLYESVPGFSSARAPERFALVAACFAAAAGGWGLFHLRRWARAGPALGWALCGLFLIESAAMPLPMSRQWEVEGLGALPAWRGGQPSPIVDAIRGLPDHAVLAVLPFGEMQHDTRAMFDSTFHWRRLVNGYSGSTPPEHTRSLVALRDPLRDAPGALAHLRGIGGTHVVVHEAAWLRDKGARVTERRVAAGAREVARAEDAVLLALD
ncbi:MAG TPA: hypothetical protein VFM29_05730 [Vicinamibacteria bacterium]|nr:hypothetical protein [Vicinamibacteria bacterium]